eukprot:Mrub_06747.p2 GENE.Mrub_06747~~Mrub_06747.p2  ORF type:complete len:261 (-),score=93.18 Mrub_06747:26-808(-)
MTESSDNHRVKISNNANSNTMLNANLNHNLANQPRPVVNANAPQADNNGLGQMNLGEVNHNEFMANMMANMGIFFDQKITSHNLRLAEKEADFQDRLDNQDDDISKRYEQVENLTNSVANLTNRVHVLTNQLMPANNGFGLFKDRILHGRWRINQDGYPWLPNPDNVLLRQFFDVIESIGSGDGENEVIFYTYPQFSYCAAGKAIALCWNVLINDVPNLDIRSNNERARGVLLDQSRFHRCRKSWDRVVNGSKKVNTRNF